MTHNHQFSAWGEFFPNIDFFKQYTNESNHTVVESNLYVFSCFFEEIDSTTDSISCISCICKTTSANMTLLIEFCSFTNCTSYRSYGGAVFFSIEGQCVISFVCGIRCHTDSGSYDGQFCSIAVPGTC